MKVIFFSSDLNTLNEWENRHKQTNFSSYSDIDLLNHELLNSPSAIVIVDYDSVATQASSWLSSNSIPQNTIILEKAPEITTGKMLIYHGVKAYGNARMLTIHYLQMLDTVNNGNIWTYPALTAKLTKSKKASSLNNDAKTLLENRLTQKEQEVVYLILEGFTNNAIASRLNITIRTVKAHISAIFSKLHINDRVSLILLLK